MRKSRAVRNEGENLHVRPGAPPLVSTLGQRGKTRDIAA